MITILESATNNPFRLDDTDVSYYNDFLDPNELNYLQDKKNRTGKIVYMTPEYYFEQCAKYIFENHTSVEELKRQRADDREDIEHYKELMQNGVKFYLPYINYANKGQEGLHRMYCAGELYGWDTKFPVLVVDVYDQEREEAENTIRDCRYFESYTMDRLVKDVLWANYYREDISNTDKWKKEFCTLLSETALQDYDEDVEFSCYFDKSDPDSLIVYITTFNDYPFTDRAIQKEYYLSDLVGSATQSTYDIKPLPDNLEAIDLDDLDLSDDSLMKLFFK